MKTTRRFVIKQGALRVTSDMTNEELALVLRWALKEKADNERLLKRFGLLPVDASTQKE